MLAISVDSPAESAVGSTSARASIDFRIIIPAIIRVSTIAQAEHIVVEDRHIAQGFIDLDVGTSLKLTSNNRNGYQLSASYDAELLSAVDVRISSQNMTASSGFGTMRVAAGLTVDKVVPVGYRFHLLPGIRAGSYRWPVALAFSLAAT